MKKYLILISFLFLGFLRGEELFHGVNPKNGQLVLSEKGFVPIFTDEKVTKLVSLLTEETACTFFFLDDRTQAIDFQGCLYEFFYAADQINSKKIWNADGTLFSHEEWDWQDGELLSHSYYDSNERLVHQEAFERDEDSLTYIILSGDKILKTQYRYHQGRLQSLTGPEGQETRYFYNDKGLICAEINSIRQFFSYTPEDDLCEVIIDDGLSEDSEDFQGASIRKRIEFIPSVKKPEVILLYSFDPLIGAEVIEKRIEGTYGNDSKLIYQELFTSHFGLEETFFDYDSFGHLTLMHDGSGNGIESFYDHENHLLRQSVLIDNAPLSSTVFTYDAIDRPIGKDQIAGNGTTTPEQYIYNPLNQIKATIDALGNRTDYAYNPLGQLIEIIHPPVMSLEGAILSPTQHWEYNSLGQLTAYIDPDGVKFTQDPAANHNPWAPQAPPLRMPQSKPETIESCYDPAGTTGLKLCFIEQDRLVIITSDALGRIVKKEHLNPEGETVSTAEMFYSAAGRPVYLNENGSITTWTYDQAGNIIAVTTANTLLQRTTHYNYDLKGYLTSICKPDGISLNFTYDKIGQLKHIHSTDGSVDEPFDAEECIVKQYDDQNHCIGFVLPDDSAVSYEWEGNALKHIYRIDRSGKILYDIDEKSLIPAKNSHYESESHPEKIYKYDLNGNLISIRSENEAIELTYDALDRLIRVKTDAKHSYSYTYDGLQRLRERIDYFEEQEISREQYLYDGPHEIGLLKEGAITAFRLLDPRLENESTIAVEIDEKFTDSHNPWNYGGKRVDRETHLVFFGSQVCTEKEGLWLNSNARQYSKHIEDNSVFSSANSWVKSNLSFEEKAKAQIDTIAHTLFKNAWLVMLGYYNEEASIGVVGNGELNDKVRVTIINGMLNIRSWAEHNAMEVSKTHGDINVHYVYRPTRGWTLDLIRATLGKCGLPSVEAKLLAETWKKLIAEMGGTEGSGTIIHYAHSIGAADTLSARHYLTPQEQRMIKVISLGSPLVIPHEGFASVINYISLRDGIRYLALFSKDHQFVYLDSYWGIPVIDHLLNSGTYKTLMENLGKAFIKEYIEKKK